MAQHSINDFVLMGDTQLLPQRASKVEVAAWSNWRSDFDHYLNTSGAYIEADKAPEIGRAICQMEWDNLHFIVCDLEADWETPHYVACDITYDDLGLDAIFRYVMIKHDRDLPFEKQDKIRHEIHDEMIRPVLAKLKEQGLHFGDEERASDGLRSLTGYWLDLMERKGKLDPRNLSQNKPAVEPGSDVSLG